MQKTAKISDCGLYRYELRRIWDDATPPLLLCMLNPSIADAEIDDPTIIRGVQRARLLALGSLIVVNLGAGRSTDPKKWMAMADPIGPQNEPALSIALNEVWRRKGIAVVGWGVWGGFMNRDKNFLQMARANAVPLFCLGRTKDGQPRHPLYISYETPLVPY